MGGVKHANGKKTSGRHTTLIDAAAPVFKFISKIPDVTSISAGEIKMNLPAAPQRVTVKEMSGCLSVKVRGTKSIQELKIYSVNLTTIKEVIEKKFL